MVSEDKLNLLAAAADYDVCGDCGSRRNNSPLRFIYNASVPGKGTVPLFKVLLTNQCVNDCVYCVNQAGRDVPRSSFQPDELAKTFMALYDKKLVIGLFLSSGIKCDASRTMEAMLNTTEILRHRYDFSGYIHLKIMPGAPFDCVEESCKLANRVSVNIESPSPEYLAKLTSKKNLYTDILERMRWVKQIASRNDKLIPSGQTTQFVAGGAGESDLDLIRMTDSLYRDMGLRRVYYSAFTPVIEGMEPVPLIREHRLYQADWLMRVYGFSFNEVELALNRAGNLPFTKNPKLVIAMRQPWLFPIDINQATYDALIRVPGIGPIAANRIIEARKEHSINSMQPLKKMRVLTGVAAPFIWFKGMERPGRQLSLFGEMDEEEEKPVNAKELVTA
jgi:predicted DNA-binding helix-hairpin-helix protein